MKLDQMSLLEILSTSDSKFKIFPYQRPYEWTIDYVDQFYEDMKSLLKEKDHYLGEVTLKEHDRKNGIRIFEIIDSQQRLITTCLFLKALADYSKLDTNNNKIYNKIYKSYLMNDDEDCLEEEKIKLSLKKNDFLTYKELILNRHISNKSSLIYKNYTYLLDKMNFEKINSELLFNNLRDKITVVRVKLEETDNAQVIFNRINNYRKSFELWDYIRFHILYGLDEKIQEKIEIDYLNKFENAFNNNPKEIKVFFRDFLIIKEKKQVNDNNLITTFKDNFIKGTYELIIKQVDEIIHNIMLYKDILENTYSDKIICKYIVNFNSMKTSALNFLLLKLLNDYKNEIISKDTLLEIFDIISSYLVRRFISDNPSNQINAIFIGLIRSIKNNNYLESLILYLVKTTSKVKFVDDFDLKNYCINTNFYGRNNNMAKYILCEIEHKYQNNELALKDNISIEHIMPQKISKSSYWANILGDDWENLHYKYVHKLGNLTLTGNNSKLGNKSFPEKKSMPNGFLSSNIQISKPLCSVNDWSINEINERSIYLYEQIIKIWKYPDNFQIKSEVPLTISDNWTTSKLYKISFGKTEFYINSITEAYKTLIENIFNNYTDEFLNMINSNVINAKDFCSNDLSLLYNQGFELGNCGIFIGTKCNNDRKRFFLSKILNIIPIKEEITFFESNYVIE